MAGTTLENIFIRELDPVVESIIPRLNALSNLKFYEIVIRVQIGGNHFEIIIDTSAEHPAEGK